MGDSMESNSELIAVQAVYERLHKRLGLKTRTVQWYATEGLIPRPVKRGGEAYYDLEESQILAKVTAIVRMQEVLELKLWQIRELINLYKDDRDWDRLVTLIENLGDANPRWYEDYNGNRRQHDFNIAVQKVFVGWLFDHKPISQMSVIDAQKLAEDFLEEDPEQFYEMYGT